MTGVALMHRGRIQAVGTPRELVAGLQGTGAETLDDVFRAYAGEEWTDTPKEFRSVRQTRRNANRLG